MSRSVRTAALLTAFLGSSMIASTTALAPESRLPAAEKVSGAQGMATDLFAKLKDGKTEEVAQWIVRQVGYTWSAQERIRKVAEFKSGLDAILLGPPEGAYGPVDGFALISESFLPGSDRFFRLVYLTYHKASPLVWEFRYYIAPGGAVTLQHIGWSPENPFSYLARPDMLLDRLYERH